MEGMTGREQDGVAALVEGLRRSGEDYQAHLPDSWLQGRTAYGGLSAALALAAAQAQWPDLPPLRSAQIAFVGPAAGDAWIRPRLLRRGRTAAYVQVELGSEKGVGLHAIFIFMHSQDSHVDLPPASLGSALPPRTRPIAAPPSVAFIRHFEVMSTGTGRADEPDIRRWARLRQRTGLDPMVELLTIGDVLPPAAMKLFSRPGPISSMNWQLNLLDEAPTTTDGWWLVGATADHARHGSSSQRMSVWNSDGQLVAAAMQDIALFA